MELVDLARQIEQADKMVSLRASAELKVVAEQIEALQDKARKILEAARRDMDLHKAQCGFKKIPGKTYYLYRRESGACYFSMLSPEDWKGQSPHAFLGGYHLAADMSWQRLDTED